MVRALIGHDPAPVDEFIARNADSIWLHQNEVWELIEPEPDLFLTTERPTVEHPDDEVPF